LFYFILFGVSLLATGLIRISVWLNLKNAGERRNQLYENCFIHFQRFVMGYWIGNSRRGTLDAIRSSSYLHFGFGEFLRE